MKEKTDSTDKYDYRIINEDKVATQKDLRILSLEIEQKILNMKMELEQRINSVVMKLGSLIIACSGILFGLLNYFQK